MPVGPYEDFEACLVALEDKYPDEQTRRKVCGAIKARTEAQAGVPRGEDYTSSPTTVEETPEAWIVKGIVATRAGVTRNGLLREEAILPATARLIDGASIVYAEHPRNVRGEPLVFVDAKTSPGFAVNGRVEGDAVVYDAVLWKQNPKGYGVSAEDLANNQAFAAAAHKGQPINQSLGSLDVSKPATGRARGVDGRPDVPYVERLEAVARIGHVAILAPVAGWKEGSCAAPACGTHARREEHDAVDAVSQAFGVPAGAAALAICDALKRNA